MTKSSKFEFCYPSNGMMWCMYPNGNYAPPFPIGYSNNKELRNLRHMRVKDFIDDKEFVDEKERIDKEIALLKECEAKNNNTEQRKEKLKNAILFISEAKTKLLSSDDVKTKTNILSYFNEEHSISEGNFVMNTYDWIQPILTSYKSLEDKYSRLGMDKKHIKQGSKGDLETIRLSWCG